MTPLDTGRVYACSFTEASQFVLCTTRVHFVCVSLISSISCVHRQVCERVYSYSLMSEVVTV